MEEFLSDTTSHGVEFLSSKDKFIRNSAIVVFLVAFCGLGFYVSDIYVKIKIDPKLISEEAKYVPSYEFPFPAITICSPLFSKDQNPNLYKVLFNPKQNLSDEVLKILAANIQAGAPHLGRRIAKIYPAIDGDTSSILFYKYRFVDDFLNICAFRLNRIECRRLFNHALTDRGYCFTYNQQGFHQIFNSREISGQFLLYRRGKIAKDYAKAITRGIDYSSFEKVDDDKDEVYWTIEKGYSNDSLNIQPTRAMKYNEVTIYPKLNYSDLSNLIPELGNAFLIYFHMPNEIVTPFHSPQYFRTDTMNQIFITLESIRTNENLMRYSPEKRGCFFNHEKSLKFFKSYTKAQCEFECLANRTFEACGCVKFSMPRSDKTRRCGLKDTSCYLGVAKKWSRVSSSCNCLPSCTRIDYKVKYSGTSKFVRTGSFKHLMDSKYEIYFRTQILP